MALKPRPVLFNVRIGSTCFLAGPLAVKLLSYVGVSFLVVIPCLDESNSHIFTSYLIALELQPTCATDLKQHWWEAFLCRYTLSVLDMCSCVQRVGIGHVAGNRTEVGEAKNCIENQSPKSVCFPNYSLFLLPCGYHYLVHTLAKSPNSVKYMLIVLIMF